MDQTRFPRGTAVLFGALFLSVLALIPGHAEECLKCHRDPRAKDSPPQIDLEVLSRSVHGTRSCEACHPEAKRVPHPAAPGRATEAKRCGRCHEEELKDYSSGIHAKAVAAGVEEAPVCSSCHGGHGVGSPNSSDSSVSPRNVVRTCANCHDDPVVSGRADLPGDVVATYLPSYHGLAQRHGSTEAANCSSCHGSHGVLPASDSKSPVHRSNLVKTCGKCHGDASRFKQRKVHTAGALGGVRGWLSGLRVFYPVANRALNPLTIAGLGGIVGILSGIFGVGGGFLLTPLLIMIGIPGAVAAATDSAQITAGASSGALGHYRHGNVDAKMGVLILVGGIVGGTAGVQVVKHLRELGNFDFVLKVVYVVILGGLGLLMLVEDLAALRGRRQAELRGEQVEQKRSRVHDFFARVPLQSRFERSGIKTSALLPFGAGFSVGVLAAFLGVGGGFIMIPAMIYLIGMPTHVAIGTDLFQITLTCANVTVQQCVANHTVDLLLAITLFAGSVLGAQVGVRIGRRLPGEQIRVLLAVIVLAVMVMLLHGLVATPDNVIALAKQAGGGH
ncbi:MAG: hypothetical protein COY42_11875 [Armatimonadetes bacterium CG_4_10_14_0_8_um_filter_66_14]|nr:MAG: hypothetical protein COY42_11875 [Armatimonadetes bacterium CG_4_10_14_0_8_um_filter_66_14]